MIPALARRDAASPARNRPFRGPPPLGYKRTNLPESLMPRADFRTPRLYLDTTLAPNASVALAPDQSNYLGNVLRLKSGDAVLAFNGRDGEWRAVIAGRKRPEQLTVQTQTRLQEPPTRVRYAFAPLKHARLDYMVQKAVEMGASALSPVLTQHTQVSRVNLERMRANVIEAAEQCGILSIAAVDEPRPLERFLHERDASGLLVFCDEDAEGGDAVATLEASRTQATAGIDVLIGPEGGFAPGERELLLRQKHIARLSLGPRILRADTAAVAALALVQAVLG
jgi:16S rRNA (uracil1498-N3)-methyltransferase